MTSREQVEQAADRLRTELLTTLAELERRGRLAVDLRYQLATHVTWAIAAVAGIVALTGVGLTRARLHKRSQRALKNRARLRGFLRAWEHPDWLAKKKQESRWSTALVRRSALAFAAAVGSQLGRYLARQWIKGSSEAKVQNTLARRIPVRLAHPS
jgi:hypothetical protein